MSTATRESAPSVERRYRAVFPGVELRAAADGGMPTLAGHFAVFNEPTEIDSFLEGNFIERIAPGAFRKTFQESGSQIKVLFQHGYDPTVGDKPLGTISSLREDDMGAAYEVQLLDTTYVRDIVPGLESGLYGASFCFRVIKEDFDQEPEESEDNPKGLPVRTLREVQVMEFGPVTFPAYPGATAGIRARSLTDRVVRMQKREDELEDLFEDWARRNPARARLLIAELRGPVAYKKTPTTDESWDGPAAEANLPEPLSIETARKAYAWIDDSKVEDGNVPKSACKFIHHEVAEDGTVGDANTHACSNGIGVCNGGRGGTTIPDEDVQGVYDHLAHHLRDAGMQPPELDRSASQETEEPAEATPAADEAATTETGDRAASDSPLSGAEAPHSDESRSEQAPLYGAQKPAPDWRL